MESKPSGHKSVWNIRYALWISLSYFISTSNRMEDDILKSFYDCYFAKNPFCLEKSQIGHIQCLQDILELEIMCLSVEPFNQLVPHIIQIKGLGGLEKPFCFWVTELAGEYNIASDKHRVLALCKFIVIRHSEVGSSLSSPWLVIFKTSENHVWHLYCETVFQLRYKTGIIALWNSYKQESLFWLFSFLLYESSFLLRILINSM